GLSVPSFLLITLTLQNVRHTELLLLLGRLLLLSGGRFLGGGLLRRNLLARSRLGGLGWLFANLGHFGFLRVLLAQHDDDVRDTALIAVRATHRGRANALHARTFVGHGI